MSLSNRSVASTAAEVSALLTAAIGGDVLGDTGSLAQYSSDASNYRVPPRVVVRPREVDDILAIAEISRETGTPVTMRGGGTSVAGNAIGPGIVIDTSRYLNRVLSVDPEQRTAVAQPGTVLTTLQKAAAPYGLRFGPDPSTQARATLGGMIGNNACGPRAVAYGRTADNVESLEVVDGRGRRFAAGRSLAPVAGLDGLVAEHLSTFRTELGQFRRQVSGYSLEHLLPENGGNLARALVGTEGTAAIVLGATVNLVASPQAPALVVLGYPDMASAADAVPALLKHAPLAIEGMDSRLVQVVREHGAAARIPELPAGSGWLFIEVGGSTPAESRAAAERLAKDAGTRAVRILDAGPEATALWRIREDGAGLGGRTPAGKQAWPAWEDAAVPPERLGSYLREFDALMAEHGVDGLPYGHFGDGCIHIRIDIPLERDGTALRSFLTDAALLVVAHGGSLSGEHGDGRARSELLSLMYSPKALVAFAQFKSLMDPQGLLNPGVLVEPDAVDANLRRPAARSLLHTSGFSFRHDDGDLTKAVHRCVGVGKCRANSSAAGGFMCPSFQATKNENDVTRGRARMLQEMINGSLIKDGWRSAEVHDALDLCLSCKACSRDCPAGVDMAQYKSEVLHHSYQGRLRPRSHYLLGWLPRWARLAGIAPRLVNLITQLPGLSALIKWVGGIDSRRPIPRFAETPFLRTHRQHTRRHQRQESDATHQARGAASKPTVVLWADSLSDAFAPNTLRAAIRLLENCGYRVIIPPERACCGLTWISTGQLSAAKHHLLGLLDVLSSYAEQGIPIVGLEPSCTAVLRSDLVDLLPEEPRAHRVALQAHSLAEVLTEARKTGWQLPDLSDVVAVVQPHCHQYSVLGFEADTRLLKDAGAQITTLAGCCGLAGNFGMEKGHYETSVSVAETALLPALRAAEASTIFLADGFSCRTQAEQLAHVPGVTLAELLAGRLETTAILEP